MIPKFLLKTKIRVYSFKLKVSGSKEKTKLFDAFVRVEPMDKSSKEKYGYGEKNVMKIYLNNKQEIKTNYPLDIVETIKKIDPTTKKEIIEEKLISFVIKDVKKTIGIDGKTISHQRLICL